MTYTLFRTLCEGYDLREEDVTKYRSEAFKGDVRLRYLGDCESEMLRLSCENQFDVAFVRRYDTNGDRQEDYLAVLIDSPVLCDYVAQMSRSSSFVVLDFARIFERCLDRREMVDVFSCEKFNLYPEKSFGDEDVMMLCDNLLGKA